MKLTVALSLLSACRLSSGRALEVRQSDWTIGQTVQTDSGAVSGHAATNATSVSEYLGIPYAQPPVGDLRFAAPVRYAGNSPVNGTNFGYSCPADLGQYSSVTPGGISSANLTTYGLLFLEVLSQFGDRFSEDCLTLNIWTKPQTGDAKKAVLLWIYGGSFATGTSSSLAYNGQYIADSEDVIVVTINYRVNIFGFPGLPTGDNNLGLRDQRLAVEWVRDNIAAFGGDPDRITLFGQSAGGASVDYYSFAYPSDPIVAGFIPESGVAVRASSTPASSTSWFNVTATLGCGNASSDLAAVLTCMRTKDYGDIIKAMPKSANPLGGSGFGPQVDGKIVFSDYLKRATTGNFIKRPVLVGSTNNEAGLFIAVAAVEGVNYPQVVWDQLNSGFTCGAALRANTSVYNHLPVWRYRYFGDFPDTRLTPNSGAYHASEIGMIFNTSRPAVIPADLPAPLANEAEIATYMRGAWTTFAKDPVNGLNTYQGGWPQYDPASDTLIRLAYNNQSGTNVGLPRPYDISCASSLPVTVGSGSSNSTSTGTSTGVSPSSSSGGGLPLTSSSTGRVTFSYTFSLIISAFVAWFLT